MKYEIEVIKVFKDNLLGREVSIGETYEVSEERYNEMKRGENSFFIVKSINDPVKSDEPKSDEPELSYKELKALAKEKGIPGYNKMKREQLIEALK